jgi:hypothetical protein
MGILLNRTCTIATLKDPAKLRALTILIIFARIVNLLFGFIIVVARGGFSASFETFVVISKPEPIVGFQQPLSVTFPAKMILQQFGNRFAGAEISIFRPSGLIMPVTEIILPHPINMIHPIEQTPRE